MEALLLGLQGGQHQLHSPRWEAGADHTASSPVASDVGREVLGSGLGGVSGQGQVAELA